jgi:small ligand-binding sensory domain FIST
MTQFKLGHSQLPDWQSAVKDCLQQTGTISSENLGFVYVTDAFSAYLDKIFHALTEQTGINQWVGSVGQGILCTQHEYYDQPAIVVMLAGFKADQFEIFSNTDTILPIQTKNAAMQSVRIALTHGDPRDNNLLQTINTLPDKMGNGYLVGGLTSASEHYFQLANEVVEGSLSGVAFSDSVEVVTSLTQGCIPLGPVHRITECDLHMAIKIDDRPALEVFKEDLGVDSLEDLDQTAGSIFAGFPHSDSDMNDYLIRNVVGIDPDNKLLAIGEILKPDSNIMFCRQSSDSARQDMQRMLNDINKRLAGRVARGGIYISCLGRGHNLFGGDTTEMNLIADSLGDIPLIGFYANGEIAGHRLYSYTGILTLFL